MKSSPKSLVESTEFGAKLPEAVGTPLQLTIEVQPKV
jgi:hypothetical protein